MKRCPQCNRVETEDALAFCRADGTPLISDSGSDGADAGAVKFGSALASEAETSVLSQHATDAGGGRSTGPTTVLDAQRASGGTRELSKTKNRKTTLLLLAAIIIVAIAGLAYYHAHKSNAAINSIAILPFQNTSGDPNLDYVSDGVTESIINSLSRLAPLKVMARSTMFRFKGRESDPQAVGKELGVSAVMTGRMLQQGENLTVSVELVNVADGTQLWGEQYNRRVSDLAAVQKEIARDISERLRLRLSSEEQQRLVKRDTTNADAYQFYLRGRYYWNKRTADGLRKAIEQFQQAVDRDPNYALAYVGLADCYLVMEQYAGTPTTETIPKAQAAAERALQIDNSLAEAHTSMGSVNENLWKWNEAGEEYRQAISLNPNYPTARHWYYIHLKAMKRSGEAEVQVRRAEELDPLSPVININFAQMYLRKDDIDQAIEQCKRIIELYPSFPGGYEILAEVYLKQRRYREAVEETSKAAELSGRASYYLGALGYCYALAGRRADALATLKELESKYARRESPPTDIAKIHTGLGNRDQAFVWLEKAFEARSGRLKDVADEPYYDLLRDDPRYADLMRRVGLPQ